MPVTQILVFTFSAIRPGTNALDGQTPAGLAASAPYNCVNDNTSFPVLDDYK